MYIYHIHSYVNERSSFGAASPECVRLHIHISFAFASYFFLHLISVWFAFAVVATDACCCCWCCWLFCLSDSICVCFYLPQYSFDMRTLKIVSWSSHCLQQLPLSSRIEQIARLILPVLKEVEWVFSTNSHHLCHFISFVFLLFYRVSFKSKVVLEKIFHTTTHTHFIRSEKVKIVNRENAKRF